MDVAWASFWEEAGARNLVFFSCKLAAADDESTGPVSRVAFNDSTVIIEDPTEFSDRVDPGFSSLRVVQ